MMQFFIYCFSCWHHAWLDEKPEHLKCSKCGSKDVGAQEIDLAWGRNWHDDWAASYIQESP